MFGQHSIMSLPSEMMALFLFLLQVVMAGRAGLTVAKQVATALMVVVVEALDTKNNFGFLSSVLKTSHKALV